MVGSLQANGLQSPYSQQDDNVAICAPAGFEIQTIEEGEDGVVGVRSFSGTSAATPVVAAALTNAMSFLPGLTGEEAKVLLQRTGIPTADGSRSVNGYKMLRVAMALKDKWPDDRDLLNRKETYDAFKSEAKENKARANALLEEATKYGPIQNEEAISKRKEALKLLRKGFFLDPQDDTIRDQLFNIYDESGYSEQALFYGPPKLTAQGPAMRQGMLDHAMIGAVGKGELSNFRRFMGRGASILAKGGSDTGGDEATVFHILERSNISEETKKEMFMALEEKLGPEMDTLLKNQKLHFILGRLTAAYGKSETLKQLLQKGLDLHSYKLGQGSLISAAIDAGNFRNFKLLLEKGASLRSIDRNFRTPLSQAVQMKPLPLEIVCVLASKNAPFSSIPGEDFTVEEVIDEFVKGPDRLKFDHLKTNACGARNW